MGANPAAVRTAGVEGGAGRRKKKKKGVSRFDIKNTCGCGADVGALVVGMGQVRVISVNNWVDVG